MTPDLRPDRFPMSPTHAQPQPQPQPPPGTDAPSHEDADALDAWLNNRALAQPQSGDSATPAPLDAGPNGQVASARQFHARFAAAEEADAPDTPMDAIWEQIMADTLIAPSPSPVPIPTDRNHSPERRPTRHPLLVAVGSHPAATGLLVAGVVLAIIFVFRSFAHDPNAPIIDYGPAALIPDATATASPKAIQLSTPDANGCIIRTLSAADLAAIANPSAMPTPNYTVDGPLNSETIARDANDTLSDYYACRQSQPKLAENQESGAVSNAMLATSQRGWTPDMRIPQSEQNLERDKALSAELVVQDPTLYIVDADDPAVRPWRMPHFATSSSIVMLPQDFVTFTDGRIGAPLKNARPGGPGAITKESFISPQTLQFVFFRQLDGVWMIDETATLCTWKCDEYFAGRQRDIDADRAANGLATPESSPSYAAIPGGARPWPSATPGEGYADPWLQPISLAECQHPYTDAGLNEQAALLLRQSTACFDQGDSTTVPADQLYSAALLRDHPELRNGQYTLTEADVANAEAIAPTVAQRDLQLYVTGIPGADDQSNRTQGFYEVFLPHPNTIELGSARFAIPLSVAFPDEAKSQQASAALASSKNPVTVAVYVLTLQDGGTPQVDDILLTCIANCDGFWEQQRSKVGTPSPSNQELATQAATATAVAEAKLPIPSNECSVPTVAAGKESLPDRAYVPLLKPTDANATEVRQDARSFIACIEASPSPDAANTPPAKIQEVVAPFETERRRTEDAAADPSLPYQPTDDQVSTGKRISSELKAQGVTTFSERAPEGVVDPGDSTWPGTMIRNGQLADTSPGWYTVPIPNMAIQLGDGRIGIPLLTMVTNDDLWTFMQEQSATQTGSLWVFAKVGDQWLMDEGLALCIGDCDAYWQQYATPLPPSEWLQPIQANECVPVSASTYREYIRPRDYMIVNTSAREDVARQARSSTACMGWGTVTPQAASSDFATNRHATEDTRRLSAEQIEGAKDLSTAYTEAGFSPYQRAPEGVDFRDAHTMTNQRADEGPIVYTPIFDPKTAVGLSDGRVAIPTTYLIADDRSWNQAQGQPLPITTTLTIWANVGGTWLIDEELPLCIGDCDSLWTYLESRVPTTPAATPTAPGTPASPTASVILPIDRRTLTV